MFGHVHLGLSQYHGRGLRTGNTQFLADYRAARPEMPELSQVIIEPYLSEAGDILWKAADLDQTRRFSTDELARALAEKIVEVYQAHQP